jgi:UDP-3-O-[3-hydroxymyristoyl] glucosamine N-acyltransferase
MEINLTVSEIKKILKMENSSDESFLVSRISSLEEARPCDMSVVFKRGERSVFEDINSKKIAASRAGLIVADKSFDNARHSIVVADPISAFEKIVNYAVTKRVLKESFVDDSAKIAKTAKVCEGCKIGKDVVVGDFSFVGENCVLEDGVVIHPGARIFNDSVIKKRAIVHSGVIIGSDGFGYVLNKEDIRKIPHVGRVVLEEDVECGPHCVIQRATFKETRIGEGSKLDSNVHVAHNTIIGKNTVILAQTVIGGSVVIGDECQIGAHIAIKDHVVIGDNVKIVSQSGVMKNIASNEIICGIPAISLRQWKKGNALMMMLIKYAKDLTKVIASLSRE